MLEFGFEHVAVATGASWRRDARGVTITLNPLAMDPRDADFDPG